MVFLQIGFGSSLKEALYFSLHNLPYDSALVLFSFSFQREDFNGSREKLQNSDNEHIAAGKRILLMRAF